MKDEKQYTQGISVKENKFLSWLDNYWYHYKWATIIAVFAVFVLLVCIIQSCSNKKSDVVITYAGPTYLVPDQKVSMELALDKSLPDNIGFSAYYILTKEQIEAAQQETDAEGYQKYIDTSFNSQEMDSLEAQLMAGSSSIILIDGDLYKMLFFGSTGETERLQPLSEIYSSIPDGAIDGYAIRLCDTELYRNNADLQRLPEDTVVCLHKKIFGQKNYDKQIETFKLFTQVVNDGEN